MQEGVKPRGCEAGGPATWKGQDFEKILLIVFDVTEL